MKGLGVMINELGGGPGNTAKVIKKMIGKTIKEVSKGGEALCFSMEDGSKFEIDDDGQSCCETRYMKCDDDLTAFSGATFQSASVREETVEDDCESHEVAFLIIETSKGSFTANMHVEHNGYYGGFSIRAKET